MKGTSSEMLSPVVLLAWETQMQQQLPAKVSVKGDVHTIALLGARLTGDSVKDVRLAAVPAIGQVSVNGDAQTIALMGARLTGDSKEDVHLAASIATGQVSGGDAQTIDLLGARLTCGSEEMPVWPQ